ncbi:hypothetical protein ACFU98_14045 [Streptomyces sp. NPDC057575]
MDGRHLAQKPGQVRGAEWAGCCGRGMFENKVTAQGRAGIIAA